MPSYEIGLILRAVNKDTLKSIVSRSSNFVINRGGVVRGAENAGQRALPFRMKAHLKYHEVGQYAFMRADMSPRVLQQLGDTLRRDTDVIRLNIVKMADQTIKELEPKRSKKCLGGVSQFEYNKAKGAIEVAEADAAAAN